MTLSFLFYVSNSIWGGRGYLVFLTIQNASSSLKGRPESFFPFFQIHLLHKDSPDNFCLQRLFFCQRKSESFWSEPEILVWSEPVYKNTDFGLNQTLLAFALNTCYPPCILHSILYIVSDQNQTAETVVNLWMVNSLGSGITKLGSTPTPLVTNMGTFSDPLHICISSLRSRNNGYNIYLHRVRLSGKESYC